MSSSQGVESISGASCPACGAFGGIRSSQRCSDCGWTYHEDCWAATGGCSRVACPGASAFRLRAVAYARKQTGHRKLYQLIAFAAGLCALVFLVRAPKLPHQQIYIGIVGLFLVYLLTRLLATMKAISELSEPAITLGRLVSVLARVRKERGGGADETLDRAIGVASGLNVSEPDRPIATSDGKFMDR